MRKPDLFVYEGGFAIRLKNRRIISSQQKDGWLITLVRIWPKGEKLRKKDFDSVIQSRFGQKITLKRLRVSDEAYQYMAEGYFTFKKFKDTQNREP